MSKTESKTVSKTDVQLGLTIVKEVVGANLSEEEQAAEIARAMFSNVEASGASMAEQRQALYAAVAQVLAPLLVADDIDGGADRPDECPICGDLGPLQDETDDEDEEPERSPSKSPSRKESGLAVADAMAADVAAMDAVLSVTADALRGLFDHESLRAFGGQLVSAAVAEATKAGKTVTDERLAYGLRVAADSQGRVAELLYRMMSERDGGAPRPVPCPVCDYLGRRGAVK